MNHVPDLQRKRLLQGLALGTAGLAFDLRPLFAGSGSLKEASSANFNPDVEIDLTARMSEASVLGDAPTKVWTFSGQLLKGPDPEAVRYLRRPRALSLPQS